jgi:5-formyltetrahydrofolate cyclo-ligase
MSFRIPPPPGSKPASKPPPPDPGRGALRARLLAARLELADREVRSRVLRDRLQRWLHTMPLQRLAFYWPTRGEPDVTAAITTWLAEDPGRIAALPVVAGQVLEFAPWKPRMPMKAGEFGIQVPDTKERIKPQLLVIPCVGIDEQHYRLGYGSGFYDRTLARLSVRPSTLGIAFDCGRVKSIDPKPHDIQLDLAITESGTL